MVQGEWYMSDEAIRMVHDSENGTRIFLQEKVSCHSSCLFWSKILTSDTKTTIFKFRGGTETLVKGCKHQASSTAKIGKSTTFVHYLKCQKITQVHGTQLSSKSPCPPWKCLIAQLDCRGSLTTAAETPAVSRPQASFYVFWSSMQLAPALCLMALVRLALTH